MGECRAKELNPQIEPQTKFEPGIWNYRDKFCTRQKSAPQVQDLVWIR